MLSRRSQEQEQEQRLGLQGFQKEQEQGYQEESERHEAPERTRAPEGTARNASEHPSPNPGKTQQLASTGYQELPKS